MLYENKYWVAHPYRYEIAVPSLPPPPRDCHFLCNGHKLNCTILILLLPLLFVFTPSNCKIFVQNIFEINSSLGDPRRPYPLDIEMRCGALGQLSQKGPGLVVAAVVPGSLTAATPLVDDDNMDNNKKSVDNQGMKQWI